MAKKSSEVRELTDRFEALAPEDRVRVLRNVLTPQMELRFAVENMRRRTRGLSARTLNRTIDQAVREVRRERAARSAR